MVKNADKKYLVGLDIGASKALGLLGFLSYKNKKLCLEVERRADFEWTGNEKREEIVEKIVEITKRLGEGLEVYGVGIGLAAILDKDRKIALRSPNFSQLDNFAIRKELERKLKKRVLIENDAGSFAWGEYLLGAGEGARSILGITLGSGLGSGIVVDGKLLKGARGGGAEAGHMIIDKDKNQSFEDFASAHFFRDFLETPKEIEDRAKRGDEKSRKIYERFGANLGLGLSNMVNVLDPDRIIIGGGLARAWPLFIKETKKTMKSFIISPASKNVVIEKAKLGKEAVATGAALLFFE